MQTGLHRNTISKVYRQLENDGVVEAMAGSGIYVRDLSRSDSVIERILDRTTRVPDPNNLDTTFVETPSFPRIDARFPNGIVPKGVTIGVWRAASEFSANPGRMRTRTSRTRPEI